MFLGVLTLIAVSFVLSLAGCFVARGLGRRLNTLDTAPLAGQVKAARRAIPNTGGVGITLAIVVPMGLALAAAWAFDADQLPAWLERVGAHLPGVRERTWRGLVLLGAVLGLHILGLIDDRKPLGPVPKLGAMAIAALAVAWPVDAANDTRLLTLLDAHVGGPWLSVVVTVLWFVVITNAMNFLDNMDGLSAGVGAVCAGCLLAAALLSGQWFVAGVLALVLGACAGFLVFNVPPASLFMGDGGSLVLGFVLAAMSVRATYVVESDGFAWHAALVPIAVLAVPLYDLVTVSAVRISQGRSPMVGDLQHASHRLVRRGMSPRAAVAVIWAFALVTGLAGVAMIGADAWRATILAAQVVLLLVVLATLEWRAGAHRGEGSADA